MREHQRKGRPAPDRIGRKNFRAVHTRNRAADRQPQPGPRNRRFTFAAPEGIKKPLGISVRKPQTVISHCDRN